jgi:hypothetical protein
MTAPAWAVARGHRRQHFLAQRVNRLISAVLDHPAWSASGSTPSPSSSAHDDGGDRKERGDRDRPSHAAIVKPGPARSRPAPAYVSRPATWNDADLSGRDFRRRTAAWRPTSRRAAGAHAQDRLAPMPRRQWPAGLTGTRATLPPPAGVSDRRNRRDRRGQSQIFLRVLCGLRGSFRIVLTSS